MSEYYAFLSTLTNLVSYPLRTLEVQIGIPVVSALLLGLIGSTSPCQLSTNIAALAYVSRENASSHRLMSSALAYLLGKVVVYSVLGILIIAAGLQLSSLAVPVAVVVRRALGPLLVLLGLFMVGAVRVNLSVGQGARAWLERKAGKGGRLGPFLLGVAFSLVFCPTLFWLFFGLVIPLGLSSPAGLIYPGIFATGTTIPLLALAGLVAFGARNVNRHIRRVKQLDLYVRRIVGIVFILVGINETIVYWLW